MKVSTGVPRGTSNQPTPRRASESRPPKRGSSGGWEPGSILIIQPSLSDQNSPDRKQHSQLPNRSRNVFRRTPTAPRIRGRTRAGQSSRDFLVPYKTIKNAGPWNTHHPSRTRMSSLADQTPAHRVNIHPLFPDTCSRTAPPGNT